MKEQDNFDDKDERQQRFQRRRGNSHIIPQEDELRNRRATPYKREQVDYYDYLEEELDDHG